MIGAHIEMGWVGGAAGKGKEMVALDHPTPLPCPMHLFHLALNISIEYLTDVRVGVKK